MKLVNASLYLLLAPAAASFAGGPGAQRLQRLLRTKKPPGDVQATTYNATLPVDHFDSSNKKTYPNQYGVNDQYYKPGGPVIIIDGGEATLTQESMNYLLGTNSTSTALAEKLNGIVIAWEHRYYGTSLPVQLNSRGIPVDSDGYKYHTIDQALQDVVYFANHINETEFPKGTVVKDGKGLDPYRTPWIFVGGSYPGSRAAWMRVKHPEIIYASWSSSAPLQLQADGSNYYNSMERSLSPDCAKTVKAAITYFDTTATGPADDPNASFVRAATELCSHLDRSASDVVRSTESSTLDDLAGRLPDTMSLGNTFQDFGPNSTTAVMCVAIENFDGIAYLNALDDAGTASGMLKAITTNPGGSSLSAANNANSFGDRSGQVAYGAMINGMCTAISNYNDGQTGDTDTSTNTTTTGDRSDRDNASWSWQVLTEFGIFEGSNPENITIISKWDNYSTVHDSYKSPYSDTPVAKHIPDQPNTASLTKLGGWDMQLSNTMFTNGEFDPWIAFSVASRVQGAPKRTITQTVPKCNVVPDNKNVFGLVFPGQAHASDISIDPTAGPDDPGTKGLDLFLKAWEQWAPCFNTSRDDVRNNRGVDGQGNGSNGEKKSDAGAQLKGLGASALTLSAAIGLWLAL